MTRDDDEVVGVVRLEGAMAAILLASCVAFCLGIVTGLRWRVEASVRAQHVGVP